MWATSSMEIGIALRARRRALGLGQAAVAERARVSRQWLVAAEAGKPTIELASLLRVVTVLGLAFDLREAPATDRSFDLDDHLAGFVD